MILIRRDLVQGAGEDNDGTADGGDDVGCVEGKQRPYRPAPAISRHPIAQALDMLPDSRRCVWREQPVRNRSARNRDADIRRAKPRIPFGIAGFPNEVTFADVGGGKNEAARKCWISPCEGERDHASPGASHQNSRPSYT